MPISELIQLNINRSDQNLILDRWISFQNHLIIKKLLLIQNKKNPMNLHTEKSKKENELLLFKDQ